MFKIVKNRRKGICVAHGCMNSHSKKDRFCSKHRHRYNKWMNPLKYTFYKRKYRAKEREIEWNLTLEEFKEFCDETNYMELKGKMSHSASIDRIDPSKGYEKGNIQILSLGDNTRKKNDRINGRCDDNDFDYGGDEDLPF